MTTTPKRAHAPDAPIATAPSDSQPELRTLADWLDAAKHEQDLKSDRALSTTLGSHNLVTRYRRGLMLPDEATMVRIAALAKRDPGEALTRLRMWVAETNQQPEVLKTYARLLEQIIKPAATLIVVTALAFTAAPTDQARSEQLRNSSTSGLAGIYIMRLRRWLSRMRPALA